MKYKVLIVPMPAASGDVQNLINTSVPENHELVSANPFVQDGRMKLLIVIRKTGNG